MTSNITCKYCQSDNVIKYGTYGGNQYYYCKDCNHKFSNPDTIPKMQIGTKCIADVLNMYYEGLSKAEIRRNLIQQDNIYISTGTIYNWVRRFTELAKKEAEKYKPKVSSVWVADETVIDLDGKNVWFWDIIDAKTRFLLASHMSYSRTTKDTEKLMQEAFKRTGKTPRVIYTDKLAAYLDGIELTFGADTLHRQGGPFNVECNTNLIERFHGTLKARTKIMRGLHTINSARQFMDGWLVHYNFFRPHMSLKGDKTPAEVAKTKFPFRDWKEICEQPYHVTARIPINLTRIERSPIERNTPAKKSTKKPVKKKSKALVKTHPTITATTIRR